MRATTLQYRYMARGLRHNTCKLLHSSTDILPADYGITHASNYTTAPTHGPRTTA